ncbi:MAG: hypothetical protein HY367_01250 [Candidatus Aenigmarchaeota archaeon]|nr:hypothetical protein [Candidatus Aenigmarchaeota archaeon]
MKELHYKKLGSAIIAHMDPLKSPLVRIVKPDNSVIEGLLDTDESGEPYVRQGANPVRALPGDTLTVLKAVGERYETVSEYRIVGGEKRRWSQKGGWTEAERAYVRQLCDGYGDRPDFEDVAEKLGEKFDVVRSARSVMTMYYSNR